MSNLGMFGLRLIRVGSTRGEGVVPTGVDVMMPVLVLTVYRGAYGDTLDEDAAT